MFCFCTNMVSSTFVIKCIIFGFLFENAFLEINYLMFHDC